MKLWQRALLALSLVLGATSAQAENYSEDINFIYREVPIAEYFMSSDDNMTLLGQFAHSALVSVLQEAHSRNLIPNSILNMQDLEQWRRGQDRVGDMVKYLNAFVAEQRRRPGRFSSLDLVPDAFILFGGAGMSLSFAGSIGGSASAGLVVMPVMVEKFCKNVNPRIGCSTAGQSVSKNFSVRLALVGIPTFEGGAGAGGSAGPLGGIGMIWDLNDAFVRPEQFWGMGGGLNFSVGIGAQVGARAGVVVNWEMPGFVDFAYAMVYLQAGAAEVSARGHAMPILNGAAIAGLIDSSSRRALEQLMKDTEKRVVDGLREEINRGVFDNRLRAIIQGELGTHAPQLNNQPAADQQSE